MTTQPARTPAPTTVVWDLGRVVVAWDPYLAVAEHRTPQEWARFAEDIDFATFNRRQDGGRTSAEAVAELARTHPEHAETFDLYMANFAGSLPGPVPGTSEIIAELHEQGVRQVGLTNWSAETFHHAEVTAPAIGLLEDIVVSGRIGLTKPDPAIFEHLLRRFDLAAERTVFVDDTVANVTSAARLGLAALHFTGADRLRAELADLGLPLRRDGS